MIGARCKVAGCQGKGKREGKEERKLEEARRPGHINGSESEWIDETVSTQRAPSPKHRRAKISAFIDLWD